MAGVDVIALLTAFFGVGSAFFALGYRRGVQTERRRVIYLCRLAVSYRWSRTVGWVWNAVEFGRPKLIPEDEFFGRETPGSADYRSTRNPEELRH